MNYCMNKITLATFSYFDVGSEGAGNQEPEDFYHGFVLGLIADQTDIYEIKVKNRESGFGRYDVMMVLKEREKQNTSNILEFKVKIIKEQTLEENSTVSTSADQRKIMMPNCCFGEYQKRRSDIMDLHLKEKCVDRIVRRY